MAEQSENEQGEYAVFNFDTCMLRGSDWENRQMLLGIVADRATEGDWLVNLKKVRRSRESFVTEIK
ncbi:hypothetical protein [Ewingella americana]